MANLNLKATYGDMAWRDNLPYKVRKLNSLKKIARYLLKTNHYSLSFAADSDFKKTNEKKREIRNLGGLKYRLVGEVVAVTASEKEVFAAEGKEVLKVVKEKTAPYAVVETEAGLTFSFNNQDGALKVGDYIGQEGRFYVDMGRQITALTKKVLIQKKLRIDSDGKPMMNGRKKYYNVDFILRLEEVKQEISVLPNRISRVKRGFRYETEKQYVDHNKDYFHLPDNVYFYESFIDLNAKTFHKATITKWLLGWHGKDSDEKERMNGIIHLMLKNFQGKRLELKARFWGEKPESINFADLGNLRPKNLGNGFSELRGFMRDNSQFDQLKKGNVILALLELTCYPLEVGESSKRAKKLLPIKANKKRGVLGPSYRATGKIISIASIGSSGSNDVLIDCGIYLFTKVPQDTPFNVGDFITISGQMKMTLIKSITERERYDSNIMQLFNCFNRDSTSKKRAKAIRSIK